MRKKIELKIEAEKVVERLKEMEALVKEAEIEETAKMEDAREQINSICEVNGLFCGVILTPDDLIAIVKLAIISKEDVRIPFNLYFNND